MCNKCKQANKDNGKYIVTIKENPFVNFSIESALVKMEHTDHIHLQSFSSSSHSSTINPSKSTKSSYKSTESSSKPVLQDNSSSDETDDDEDYKHNAISSSKPNLMLAFVLVCYAIVLILNWQANIIKPYVLFFSHLSSMN